MNTRRMVVVVGVLSLAAALVAFRPSKSDDTVTVTAVFNDASPLLPGNVVKASGVDVGKVSSIQLRNGRAHVKLELERAVLPLHDDVKVTITTQDLLGERFVRLDQGSPNRPVLDEPLEIPEKQTARVVDLQDVLNAVNTPTSRSLAAMLTVSGESLRGQGKKADAAVAALAPAMRQADDLASILRDQNKLLGQLVDSAQPVATALAGKNGVELDSMVDSATRLLESVTAERTALRESLRQLPATLSSARRTLAEVAGVARPTTRTLRALRPVTGDLEGISSELDRFASAADPALASLPAVLKEAERLLHQAAPVVAALRPAGRALVPISASAETLSRGALSGHNLTNLMEFVKGWSLATSDYDAISHYFKAMVPLSPNALGDTAAGFIPSLPDNGFHDLPVPTAPDLGLPGRTEKDAAGETATSVRDGTSVVDDGAASATGLSEKQELLLVEQILGGLL